MTAFDARAGVRRNKYGYNLSSTAVAIAANATTGATYFADRAQAVELIISGTFSGTLEVQSAPINADLTDATQWGTVAEYTEPVAKIVEIAAPTTLRVYSTSWSSGTAKTSIIGGIS